MPGTVVIRPCEARDEAVWAKLNLDFMGETMATSAYWSTLGMPSVPEMTRRFREAMAAPGVILLFLVESDGEPAGFLNSWTVYSVWSGGMALTVDDLYVAPEYRRLGVGEKAMRRLVEYAAERGFRRVQLHAETDNVRAHGLYRKLGFAEEGILFFMKHIE